jgi:diaminopimelate epimerase
MGLAFSKMHGIGNDFVVFDHRGRGGAPDRALVQAMADRHTGVGFDQLLTIEDGDGECAFRYGIWNADGSAAGQCGNGVRCVAAWLHRAGALPTGEDVRLRSPSGTVSVRVEADGRVAVDMGEPVFAPARIPFHADQESPRYALQVDAETVEIGAVSMGNPHAVVDATGRNAGAIERLGPAITHHARFPEQCNVGFVALRDRGHAALRVHERGSGWTRACGTGACAAMAVLRRRGDVESRVDIDLPGGTLQIDWPGPGHPLWMTGPAAFVFDGTWLAAPSPGIDAGGPAAHT